MCKLDMTRIENELYWRLLIFFEDTDLANIMVSRCINAIKCKDTKKLYAPIKITKTGDEDCIIANIDEKKVLDSLTKTGVHDIVCLCINAQS